MALEKLWGSVGTAVGRAITLVTIPLAFLNFFGGIVSGICLMILGRWAIFGLGLAIFLGGASLLGFVLMPAFGAQAAGALLLKSNRTIGGSGLLLIGALWTYCLMFVWCAGIFALITGTARGQMVPLALWGYANAVGPWTYMASKDEAASGSVIAVFAAQLGCVAMMAAVLFLHATPTFLGLSPYLFPFIAAAVVVQMFLAVLLALTTASERGGSSFPRGRTATQRRPHFWHGPITNDRQAKLIVRWTGWSFILLAALGVGSQLYLHMYSLLITVISWTIIGVPAALLLYKDSRIAAFVLLSVSVLSSAAFLARAIFGGQSGVLRTLLEAAIWLIVAFLCWRAFKATGALRKLRVAPAPSDTAAIFD